METGIQHLVIRVSDFEKAKDFYCSSLGLRILEEAMNFVAVSAGNVRLSIFGGYESQKNSEDPGTGVSIIFRVPDLDESIRILSDKGIKFNGEVIDIPDFHKFIEFEDPDGNVHFLGQYHKEPI